MSSYSADTIPVDRRENDLFADALKKVMEEIESLVRALLDDNKSGMRCFFANSMDDINAWFAAVLYLSVFKSSLSWSSPSKDILFCVTETCFKR